MPIQWTLNVHLSPLCVFSCEFPAVGSLGPLNSNVCFFFLSKEAMKMAHGVKHVYYVGFFLFITAVFSLSPEVWWGGRGPPQRWSQPPAPACPPPELPSTPHFLWRESQTSIFPQTLEPDHSWSFIQGLLFRPIYFQNNSLWFVIN